VSKDGYVKVLDFGLAKLAPTAGDSVSEMATIGAPQTQDGVVMGTVGYMSPEQARGVPADFRADQFSLGAVLYEMVTGKRPFQRDSAAQTLAAIIESDPPNAAELNPRVPLPLRWIIERCLAKDPEDRYASTRDLARDLQSVRDHLSEAGTTTAQQMVAQPAPVARRRALQAAALALVMLLIGGAAGYYLARPQPVEPPALRVLTFSGLDEDPSISPDGRTVAFISARDGVPRVWLRQLTGGGEAPLTSGPDFAPRISPDGSTILFSRFVTATQSSAIASPTGFGRTAVFRIPTVGGEPRKVLDDALEADWSPDGSEIAFLRRIDKDGRTQIAIGTVPSSGGEGRIIHVMDRSAGGGIRWSPDGRRMVATFTSAGLGGGSLAHGLLVVNRDGTDPRYLVVPARGSSPSAVGGSAPSAAAWVGAGSEVVYGVIESAARSANTTTNSTRVVLQNVDTGEGHTLLSLPVLVNTMNVAGPGKLIFDQTTSRSNLRAFVVGRENDARWLTRGSSIDRQPIFSPDGKWVAFTSNRSGNLDIWLQSLQTAQVRPLTDHTADDWDPAFVRNDGRILFSSIRAGHFEIWMADADGSRPRQVSNDGVDAENPTATPDGRWVVYNSGNPEKLGIWKVRDDGSEPAHLYPGSSAWPETSPDGQYVVFTQTGAQQNTARVLRLSDGKLMPFEIRAAGSMRARWMPDGRAIAFVGTDDRRTGVFVQNFAPDQDTTATRRKIAGFMADYSSETFTVSPDGRHIVLSMVERNSGLIAAEGVPGIVPPRKR
jgi:Tol biopolymer transport system component